MRAVFEPKGQVAFVTGGASGIGRFCARALASARAHVFGRSRSENKRRRIREVTPLGYVQRLKALRGPLVFFASRASDFVTDQNLVVDSGHTLGTWRKPLEGIESTRVGVEVELEFSQ